MTTSNLLALKAVIKSKFAEAKFIKQEARKLHEKMNYLKLSYPLDSQIEDTGIKFYKQVFTDTETTFFGMHREEVLAGHAARSYHLAYAFLRNTPYHTVESFCKYPPDLEMIASIASGYDDQYRTKEELLKEISYWSGYPLKPQLNAFQKFFTEKTYRKYKNKCISLFVRNKSLEGVEVR